MRDNRFINIVFRILFTSLGAVAEVVAIYLIFDRPIIPIFLLYVIILISTVYTLDFFREYQNNIHAGHRKFLISIIAILFILDSYFLYLFKHSYLIYLSIILLLLGTFYDAYFKRLTTRIIGFKDLYVSLTWNLLILMLLLTLEISSSITVILFLIFVFSRDLSNISFCDIKDIASDKEKRLKTFAAIFGTNKLINLEIGLAFISTLILLYGVSKSFFSVTALFLLPAIFLTSFLILFFHNKRKYSPSIVDFEYFGWLIFILVGRFLWN